MTRRMMAGWVVLSACSFANSASAEGVPPVGVVEVGVAAPPQLVAPAPPHRHEGLYLRAGLGGGGLVDSFHGGLGWVNADASGGSSAFELAVGTSISPGIIVGGMLTIDWVVSPSITVAGLPVASTVGVGAFTVLGPFVDWYLNPERGLHLQAMLGGARITVDDKTGTRSDHSPIGGGGSVGIGYEWRIGDGDLGLGGLLRATAGTLSADGVTHKVAAVSLLATLTYN